MQENRSEVKWRKWTIAAVGEKGFKSQNKTILPSNEIRIRLTFIIDQIHIALYYLYQLTGIHEATFASKSYRIKTQWKHTYYQNTHHNLILSNELLLDSSYVWLCRFIVNFLRYSKIALCDGLRAPILLVSFPPYLPPFSFSPRSCFTSETFSFFSFFHGTAPRNLLFKLNFFSLGWHHFKLCLQVSAPLHVMYINFIVHILYMYICRET